MIFSDYRILIHPPCLTQKELHDIRHLLRHWHIWLLIFSWQCLKRTWEKCRKKSPKRGLNFPHRNLWSPKWLELQLFRGVKLSNFHKRWTGIDVLSNLAGVYKNEFHLGENKDENQLRNFLVGSFLKYLCFTSTNFLNECLPGHSGIPFFDAFTKKSFNKSRSVIKVS